MSVFFIGIMLNLQILVYFFRKHLKQLTILTQFKLDKSILGIYKKFQSEIPTFFRYVLYLPRIPFFYNRNDRERNGTFTEMCGAL